MSTKILIIGQAPPIQKQDIPYDTTMLYDWLSEVGISKDKAQDMFEFEAMTDKIPEVTEFGHKPPSDLEMKDYWKRVLCDKVDQSEKIILLGACPRNFFKKDKFFERYDNKRFKVLSLIHPSKRNYKMYNDNKEKLVSLLKDIIFE
ncbi:uracil-DNA glycosylase [Cellulophaga phage phi4:1]|uniref:Uracil-DNA glycosylase n=5 Tax=Lightbulbvirus TaxID=1918522 RepID=A0A0S2MWC4_9CAUD|nr:uracil-DNA glycosylase [Cellulophaga phage phi4:1]YP_008241503.1 uracil-DNA glycosylase [Cellulophaga phage phi17:2]ALO80017.1 uracil-DNA glycosylase [Cellulophaga phage phi4:1_13]ALO80214.1 uracil-DNA glycosylase [Cellulophaga phage phi4:1_18]ALO80411.1 uracil-DNA glycosylase [Cellulophaga phage phi17:2_18]AGO47541.1 uracil-DNA glycosylase [Cellulophaga phage phi17:2]AGO49421.1 uracil-DNA glycosylase [Cellulophaga phage phi4:1]